MCIPTMWHSDINRLRRACVAAFLSLETPNDVQSVAYESKTIQATSKGSYQTALMHSSRRRCIDKLVF